VGGGGGNGAAGYFFFPSRYKAKIKTERFFLGDTGQKLNASGYFEIVDAENACTRPSYYRCDLKV
jgi:hypothetical protein